MDPTIVLDPVMPAPSVPRPSLNEVARTRIRLWLRSTGTTQTQLADRIHKTQAWMSRYLSGGLNADLDALRSMAEAFGHSLSALLDTPTDPTEAQLIDLFRALRLEDKETVLRLLDALAHPPIRKKPGRVRG
jgi:transcriptional regulator with XRE-family HTH domain